MSTTCIPQILLLRSDFGERERVLERGRERGSSQLLGPVGSTRVREREGVGGAATSHEEERGVVG